jgi:predicted phosphate transport protein (TIGR00153 family)
MEVEMLRFFFKKQRKVESLIYQYLDNFRQAQKRFEDGLYTCLAASNCADVDFLAEQTHKFESRGDDIREEIKTLMYGKALIPESRGDIMGLLEAVDEIPGLFQLILYMIKTQKMLIPDFIVSDIKELIEVSLASCDLMLQQIERLFQGSSGVRALVSSIDHNESQCDYIERRIITNLFDSDLDPFQKLQLKELVVYLGELSDQTDRVSRRVSIIKMKRTV